MRRMKQKGWVGALGLAVTVGFGGPARADAIAGPRVEFRDDCVAQPDVVVKPGAALELHVVNSRKEAVEFESFELNRERVVQPGQEIVVFLPALSAGTYPFFDDFHRDCGAGTITARE